MKKIVLSIATSMLLFCSVQAQQSDRERSQDRRTRQQQSRPDQTPRERDGMQRQQQVDGTQGQDNYANEGMVVIDKSEIPSSLKQTLQDEKYEGWENGTIYHNTNTGEYVIAPRAFRFDRNGEEMEMTDQADNSTQRRSTGQPGDQTETPSDSYRQPTTRDQNNNNATSPGQRSREDDATGAGTQTQPGQSGREHLPQNNQDQ